MISAAELMQAKMVAAKLALAKPFIIPQRKTTWTEKTAPVRFEPVPKYDSNK